MSHQTRSPLGSQVNHRLWGTTNASSNVIAMRDAQAAGANAWPTMSCAEPCRKRTQSYPILLFLFQELIDPDI
jgi:hypothetical protein